MAVVDALGQPGRAGRVERRRARVLVELREGECRRRAPPASTRTRRRRRASSRGAAAPSLISTSFTPGRIFAWIASEERQEFGVDEDHVVLGVVDRVEHLLGRDPDVHRVQHRAHHRHGEKAFEVAVAVPVHDGDGGARLDAQRVERRREAAHALAERRVRVAQLDRRRRSPARARPRRRGRGSVRSTAARRTPTACGRWRVGFMGLSWIEKRWVRAPGAWALVGAP